MSDLPLSVSGPHAIRARMLARETCQSGSDPAVKAARPAQRIPRSSTKSSGAYSSALVTRLNEDWPVAILSADAATRWSLRQLRARSRHLERNGGIHNAYLCAREANIIGSKGIGVQMKIKKDRAVWSTAMDYGDARPAKARFVEDPREKSFLKALKAKAETFTRIRSGEDKRTFLRDQDPAWKSAVVMAVRDIKSGQSLFAEDDAGAMTAGGEIDRYACFLVEQELKEFSKRGNCDVTGKHSLMDLCRLTLRTSMRDGDAYLLAYFGYPNKWGVAFQLIEGDYVDDYYNVERLENGNRIRMGIELDPFGRKVAAWVFAHHPGDYGVEGVQGYDSRRRRIPMLGTEPGAPVQCIHVTKSKRAEETRAVPWITPAMELIHHIETFKEAEITAARAEACKHVMYERDAFSSDGTALEWEDVNGQLTDELQPGGATELPPGVRANYIDPKHPNTAMPDFLKAMKREVAMALDHCYNSLFGDLSDVNYSSIRAGTLNERESYKMDQSWFGDDVFTPIFETFLRMSLLTGAVPFKLSEFDRLNAPEFKFRRWAWVDPKNDAETAKLLLDLKITTRSRLIADMSSDDFEETIDELDYEAGYIAAKENLRAADEQAAKLENPAPAPKLLDRPETVAPEQDKKQPKAAVKSAFLGEVPLGEMPDHVQQIIGEFVPGADPTAKVIRYQMTVPELLAKADPHNLQTAQRRVRNRTNISAAAEVLERKDKQILLLNDRIIDGHHHLAKAEKGKVTSSLAVIDLTPLRYQGAGNAA